MIEVVEGCQHDEGSGHDCAYVDWRNSLIPLAEAIADAEAGPEPSDGGEVWSKWSWRWDARFHLAMNRLTKDPFISASVDAETRAAS